MRTILATLALLLAACDPCAAAYQVHEQRCASGIDAESCEWIQENAGQSCG
jgi:hypothetical protein